jgi:hypothetical protein
VSDCGWAKRTSEGGDAGRADLCRAQMVMVRLRDDVKIISCCPPGTITSDRCRSMVVAMPRRETSPPAQNWRKSRISGTWWMMEEVTGAGTMLGKRAFQRRLLATNPMLMGRTPCG